MDILNLFLSGAVALTTTQNPTPQGPCPGKPTQLDYESCMINLVLEREAEEKRKITVDIDPDGLGRLSGLGVNYEFHRQ